jgi:hypothetical protein
LTGADAGPAPFACARQRRSRQGKGDGGSLIDCVALKRELGAFCAMATPAGIEPATFSLEGYQEAKQDQRRLTLLAFPKVAFLAKS